VPAVTHLGLLGQRRSLGAANAVTLARGCLPALADGRWTGGAALAADFLDGQLARRRGEATVFGSYADTIADAAFWNWFAALVRPAAPLAVLLVIRSTRRRGQAPASASGISWLPSTAPGGAVPASMPGWPWQLWPFRSGQHGRR
jgi:CDP-alcohol phosphatidyltransferase